MSGLEFNINKSYCFTVGPLLNIDVDTYIFPQEFKIKTTNYYFKNRKLKMFLQKQKIDLSITLVTIKTQRLNFLYFIYTKSRPKRFTIIKENKKMRQK